MSDFLFKKEVDIYDPNVSGLVEFEAERQARRLIMIPSESIAPKAVRDLLASPFANIYAEGYPRPETRYQDEDTLMDYAYQLGRYRLLAGWRPGQCQYRHDHADRQPQRRGGHWRHGRQPVAAERLHARRQ